MGLNIIWLQHGYRHRVGSYATREFERRFSVAYPQLEHLAEFTKIRDAVELCRVLLAFGICGYVIGPRGADRLLPHCFPLDNRPVRLAASTRRLRAYGVDCMIAARTRRSEHCYAGRRWL